MIKKHLVIIGGGTAGIMVAAQLMHKSHNFIISLIEPSKHHYYQPAFTLVGAGTFRMEDTIKLEESLIPKGVSWIQAYATSIDPDKQQVSLSNNSQLSYDALVIATGLVNDFSLLPGLAEAIGKNGVCSNYVDPTYTWEVMQAFKGGNAVFTQPTTPIKCGGAPQKAAYMAEDYFRKKGIRKNVNLIFATPGSTIFGVRAFAITLEDIIRKRNILFKPFYAPIKIDGENKVIHFKYAKPGDNACIVTEDTNIGEVIEGDSVIKIKYDMLHLAPPQRAPDFIKNSKLAVKEGPSTGWLAIDKFTLKHNIYDNIYGLGDVAALPSAKTGAAIRKQVPVVVANLLAWIDKKEPRALYDGYSSCPLVTGYGKMVLAEFKYDNIRASDPLLSKLIDTTKEQWSMWLLKKYGLPYLYWHKMMRGTM